MKKVILVLIVSFFFISQVSAQQGNMAVGGQVGISLPLGDFGDAANMGFGFIGNYYYGVTPDIDLTGTIGYYTWGGDTPAGSKVDVSFSDVPIVVGGRYYFNRSNFDDLTPYAMAELGLHIFSGGYSYSYVDPFSGQTVASSGDDSSTKFGLGIGGGFSYNMGEMMLDVNGKFNIISDANHITLMAGIKYPLEPGW